MAPSLNGSQAFGDPSPGDKCPEKHSPPRSHSKFFLTNRRMGRGCGLGIVGSAVACFGAQQVLGNMVVRMLLVRGLSVEFWLTNPPARLQALDLFAMQASGGLI